MIITSTTRAASRAKTRSCSSDFPPPDFNAGAMPILATHWFDRRPEVATQDIPDGNPRFQEARAA